MPLSLAELEELQAAAMADDVEIDLAEMSLWTEDEARSFFESGGAERPEPAAAPPPPPAAPSSRPLAWWRAEDAPTVAVSQSGRQRRRGSRGAAVWGWRRWCCSV